MKIMTSVDKKVGDKTYYKYKINLPKKIVEESNFLDKELNISFEKDKIIIGKNIQNILHQKLTEREKRIQKELIKLIKKT